MSDWVRTDAGDVEDYSPVLDLEILWLSVTQQ